MYTTFSCTDIIFMQSLKMVKMSAVCFLTAFCPAFVLTNPVTLLIIIIPHLYSTVFIVLYQVFKTVLRVK